MPKQHLKQFKMLEILIVSFTIILYCVQPVAADQPEKTKVESQQTEVEPEKTEVESQQTEDDEDDLSDYTIVKYKGSSYLKNTKDNKLYTYIDGDKGNCVGELVNKKIKFY